MLLLLSVVLILLLMVVLFYYQVALPLASAIFVLAWLALGMLTPVLWSLWLVVPGDRAGGVKSAPYPTPPVVQVRVSCAEQSAAAYESDRGRSVGGGNHLVGERPV